MDRRRFTTTIPGLLASFLFVPGAGPIPAARQGKHPEPRRGVNASKIVPREKLADSPEAIPVFDMAREIPQVLDGLRCQCGCSELPDHYSLLSCFEDGMATHCEICMSQTKLAHRLHKDGKSLREIRAAIDAEFGN